MASLEPARRGKLFKAHPVVGPTVSDSGWTRLTIHPKLTLRARTSVRDPQLACPARTFDSEDFLLKLGEAIGFRSFSVGSKGPAQ